MTKVLYTIGDSWTFGSDLDSPETECYPYLLSKKLDCDLINDGMPGASNDWMFRRCIDWLSSRDRFHDIIVIVGWSNPNRREENFGFVWGGHISWWDEWEWSQINDKNREKSKFISKYLHDEVLSYKKTLTYMITLQEFLKSKNIKYLFYDPFVNILVKDDYYYEVIEKEKKRFISFPYKEEVVSIENIHEKIDKRFYFGPEIDILGFER